MAQETKIQWCDSTVNPIMGCAGCELFPTPVEVLNRIDEVANAVDAKWKSGEAKRRYRVLIDHALEQVAEPERFKKSVTTTHIHHFRKEFADQAKADFGRNVRNAVEQSIAKNITCYAATLHLNRGLSLKDSQRAINAGHAPTFEVPTRFEGRVAKMAAQKDLLGTTDPDRPWIDGLPRLVFVSDMGDAFSRKKDFSFLRQQVIEPIRSDQGKRHIWLWLTKRPQLMAQFAESIGGFPENVCAMTTVVTALPDSLSRIYSLRKVKAAVRGLSIEPLWERLPPDKLKLDGIDWVILGGESGAKVEDSRPFALEWVAELRDHCEANGVAFFVKQLGRRPTLDGKEVRLRDAHGGDWSEWPEVVPRLRMFPQQFHDYREGEPRVGGVRRPRPGGLSAGEAKRFEKLNKRVAKFAKDIVKVSEALSEIKRDKLYRAKFKTFQEYCESVHQISRQYANRLARAGEIYTEMVPIVSKMDLPMPDNEAQLRELARLPDANERVEVLQAVVAGHDQQSSVTAKAIHEEIDRRLGDKKADTRNSPTPTERIRNASALVDKLEAAIESGDDLKRLLRALRKALGTSSREG